MFRQAPVPQGREGFEVTKLIGVYNMDDTVLGRSAFKWAGARHRKRCPLYEITHAGGVRGHAWEALATEIPVPIEFVARNDRSPELMVATGGIPPCIVAQTAAHGWLVVVLGSAIEACAGDPQALLTTIEEAIPRWSLHWGWH
jgi:hypothetical protein